MSQSDGNCQLTKTKDVSLIYLKSSVRIQQAATLKTILIEAINEKKAIRIDMSEIKEIDVTTIQLLYAAKNKAFTNNIDFNIFPISEQVKDELRASGALFELFNLTS